MTTYDFLSAKQMILSNVWTDSNFTWYYFWYELGKIMTRYDFLDARFVIWLAIDLLLLLVNIWFWAKNDQIWQPEARWMIFCNIRTDFNFIFGQVSVARKLILNGGAIRPIGLLFGLLDHFLKNCSITFVLFLHEASLGWYKQHIISRIWLNHSKGCFLKVKGQNLTFLVC